MTNADGSRTFSFRAPPKNDAVSAGATATGGFLTGLLGVGMATVTSPLTNAAVCTVLQLPDCHPL